MDKSQKLDFANIILHSFSQIMLQENRYTGLLFMLGILIGDWQYLLAALLAVLSGNGAAILLGFNCMNLNSGIYGFSSALVGVVLLFLFESSWSLWLLVMIGGFLSTLLQEAFIRLKIAGYTFPFILVSWILIGFINHYSNIGDSQITQCKGDFLSNEIIGLGFKGFGQVIFQEGFLVGILFFVGVCLSSSISGIYGLMASFLGGFMAYLFHLSTESIYAGIFGFNAVLTAIALSGNRKTDLYWVLIGVILTFFLQYLMMKLEFFEFIGGVLTFPFVLATWMNLGIRNRLSD